MAETLNFSNIAAFNVDDKKLLDEGVDEAIRRYNQYVSELVVANGLAGKLLLHPLSCRNTLQNSLLKIFTVLVFLEAKFDKGCKYDDILVPSDLFVPVSQFVKNYSLDIVVVSVMNRPSFKSFLSIFKTVYVVLFGFFFIKLFLSSKRIESREVILVDTFLFENSFDEQGVFDERFYSGHETCLSIKENSNKIFFPTLVGILRPSQVLKLARRVKKSNSKFIFEQSYCSFFDYICCIIWFFRIGFSVRNIPTLDGLDITEFVKNENNKVRFSPDIFRSLLKFFCIKRMCLRGVRIAHAIDWSENQIIDRAFNLALKECYPNVTVYGYQGFMVPEYYACAQPQLFEEKLGTLPDEYRVLGPYANALRNSSTATVPVKVASAFRYSYLFEIERTPLPKLMVVALPIMMEEAENILDMIAGSELDDWTIYVKPHPSFTKSKIEYLKDIGSHNNVQFVADNMRELLKIMTIMVSSTSTSCLEALALNIPVVVVSSGCDVTMNPIPKGYKCELWTVAYRPRDLKNFVSADCWLEEQNNFHSKTLVNDLFEPVSCSSTRELFGLKLKDEIEDI